MRILFFLLAAALSAQSIRETSHILGRPTDRSVTVSVLSPEAGKVQIAYGTKPGTYSNNSKPIDIAAGRPAEILLDNLRPDTRYFYRVNRGDEQSFHTQRAPGSTFSFGVQGDSHPERLNRMYHPDVYLRTMQNARAAQPDFYITMGDDFNLEPLYNRGKLSPETVGQLYVNQRSFLGLIGTPLFLVNGNHEQAAKYLLDGTPNSIPVIAGRARNLYFPQPAPDRFYTGDEEQVEHVGYRRDYYAWTWGDALFVTLDPYWHSPVMVDNGLDKTQRKNRDGWAATMGDAQYQWFRKTLEQSKAKYKFVFAHHVLGTGRGGVEIADLYEWGGRNRQGQWEFEKKRPGWPLPIHQLMVKHGVTIFFQGHDHLFARQQKDGVIYQELPVPADNTYTTFNKDAYTSGDVLPNAGYVRVTVAPASVDVEYIRSWAPKDETPERKNGETAFRYTVKSK